MATIVYHWTQWEFHSKTFFFEKLIIGPGSHVGFPICTKITNLVEDLPMNISVKFGPNLFSGFREEDENMKSDDKSSHGPLVQVS
jgi:hypothetical protein